MKTAIKTKPKELTFEEKLKRWKARELSWSQISSFEYDPDQWYRRYFEREEQYETAEMVFGKIIGERMAKDPTFLPFIKRLDISEHPFRVVFDKIPMVGYADFFCSKTGKKIQELKTGVKKWDQKRADEHGQIDAYLLMHYITTRIKPEDVEIELIWLPTERAEDGDFNVDIKFVEPIEENYKIFKTKRTMADILNFGSRIRSTYKAMEAYARSRA